MTIIRPILPEDIEHMNMFQKLFCYPRLYVEHNLTDDYLADLGGYLCKFAFEGQDEYSYGETYEEAVANMNLYKENLA